MEDLLDAKFGKHDYDWLLTPRETPLAPHLDDTKDQPSRATPNGRTSTQSVSTARASRLSAPHSENSTSTRPVRSSSVTRPSICNTHSTSFSSYNNSKTSVLNMSLASVTSQPATQGNRLVTARPSPSSRPSPARSSTPVRTRPPSTSAGVKTARPQTNSRPSTPTSRPQIPTNSNPNVIPLAPRSNSRPSTPTRRPLTPTIDRSQSIGQIPTPTVRPSSPGPRARASGRTADLPDFPVDARPKLRTKLPERPGSAGRTCQGTALTASINSNVDLTASSLGLNRRHSLPVVSQVKFPETSAKANICSNGHDSEGIFPRPNKVPTATDSSGFGRTISKTSLDMALRHMDIRQGMGSIRGASVFPHSVRPTTLNCRPAHKPDRVVPVMTDKDVADDGSCNGTKANGSCNGTNPLNHKTIVSDNGDFAANRSPSITRESNLDLYGSYRYDAMLLKEDSKNMSWLHSTEDNSDRSPRFDHRFEPLPEPFGIL